MCFLNLHFNYNFFKFQMKVRFQIIYVKYVYIYFKFFRCKIHSSRKYVIRMNTLVISYNNAFFLKTLYICQRFYIMTHTSIIIENMYILILFFKIYLLYLWLNPVKKLLLAIRVVLNKIVAIKEVEGRRSKTSVDII